MLSLCAFNEGLPRSRAARTKEHDRRPRLFFPLCPKPLSYKKQKGGPGNSRLRASSEHNLIARVLRDNISHPFPLPTAAETTIEGRRAETEAAIAGEGRTQLAAARDRFSS